MAGGLFVLGVPIGVMGRDSPLIVSPVLKGVLEADCEVPLCYPVSLFALLASIRDRLGADSGPIVY